MTAVLFPAAIALVLLMLLLKTPMVHVALDRPNHRSLHNRVVPRTGGLAIMLATLIAWWMQAQPWIWTLSSLMLVIVSLVDDVHNLPAGLRLFVQLAIAIITLSFMRLGGVADTFLLVLALAWMTNLYNFMDGSDGLAGGMAVIGFGAYAIAASEAGHAELMLLSGTISSASLAFLIFNFYPARIFMGDAGSIPLGFLAGAFGIFGWQQGIWPLWFPLLVFSAFIFDASLTLAKRALRGERIWEAHRSHYYQRLVQMGWGHRKTAIVEYGLMLATAGSALAMIDQRASLAGVALIGWLSAYALLAYLIDRAWKSFNSR